MGVFKHIHKWYQGEHVTNDPDDPIILIGVYDRHWTAEWTRASLKWLKKEYKWWIPLLVTIILGVAALILKSQS